MEDLADLIFRIAPAQSPFVSLMQHNRRKLGRMKTGLRGIKRRLAKPSAFFAAQDYKPEHEWRFST